MRRPEVIDFLATRRSVSVKTMQEPGPDREELREMLDAASRVPDHRKLEPWRFVVATGAARERLGEASAERHGELHPDTTEKQTEMERKRFTRAPAVVAVVSSPKECRKGTPVWEQELAVGAVCYNLLLAAKARGWGAQWLTEWLSYDEVVGDALGLKSGERIAGFVHIGTPALEALSDRPRPDVDAKVEWLS